MAKRFWLCRCGARLERTKQKCACGRRRPAPRVPKHARTLQADSYEVYKRVNADIHGVTDESCAICAKPRGQHRRHDRDHDHKSGKPRGLLCARCNQALPSWITQEWLELAAGYLWRVEYHYREAV